MLDRLLLRRRPQRRQHVQLRKVQEVSQCPVTSRVVSSLSLKHEHAPCASARLTNGVKYSKVLNLPEILCVHLKRFRHDSMFATGKVNTYVSFPIDGLDMKPFVHKGKRARVEAVVVAVSWLAKETHTRLVSPFAECKNLHTCYDLCSVICHYGGANGGHYTSYARNYANEEWYEYDDSFCRQVDTLAVQNAQAYVLFYK